jgi:hypothetical protein
MHQISDAGPIPKKVQIALIQSKPGGDLFFWENKCIKFFPEK